MPVARMRGCTPSPDHGQADEVQALPSRHLAPWMCPPRAITSYSNAGLQRIAFSSERNPLQVYILKSDSCSRALTPVRELFQSRSPQGGNAPEA
jgi:hypothetical protein